MSADHIPSPWAIRSTLISVAELERSVEFYRELGSFGEILHDDAIAVLGGTSSESIVLILRETRGVHVRHGQQSLGLRTITFNVRTPSELDRVESVLRSRDLFTARRHIGDHLAEMVSGRDLDNMPLAFICYNSDESIGSEYYQAIVDLIYALDM